ncbi:MAG: YebC/PmpR family DNA-binding transcriptional regulator [Verrucomicrobia bacterium 21-51-4]|nr:MAG: YebC/PmpR family DNA-binding transcriptional regulator [Verrucomicrobia bacterium 21-51-4]HQU09039.1 YebC/PmpR family DNA-binding transcriptional regulator [Opitutales bacterium]
MSGHSKWATIKRHKASVDSKRGKMFSIVSKELTISARSGGGDPNFNARLRTLILKAKQTNMPADNIERAIKKGTGELPGQIIEELFYEGYGPCGVGLIVEATTDNKNRSASEVRSTFGKNGGNMGGAGAVAFNFQHLGQFLIDASKISEDALMELALEAGADDVKNEGDHYEVLCAIPNYDKVALALEQKGIVPESSELAYIPNSTIELADADAEKQLLKLIEALEELEDVKAVWDNAQLS